MYYEYADIKFKQVRSSTSQQLPRSDLTIRSSSNYDETLKMKETLGEDSPSISDNSTTLLKVNVTPRNEENDLNNQCSDAESLQSRDTNCLEFHFFPVCTIRQRVSCSWSNGKTFPSMIPHGNQPNIYQPAHVIDDFHQPEVSEECLLAYSDILEAIQSRLSSTNNRISIPFPTKLFKFLFGADNSQLVNKDDFKGPPLSPHWFVKLNVHGQGTKLEFPVQVKSVVSQKKVYLPINNKSVQKSIPTEKLIIVSSTTVCCMENINM
ncbi:AF17_10 [Mytilus edulis]|uniref:MLLT6_10 n=1 Tax=Mytilus edulis TaxID=6550 RepID=A0A8S3S6C5_MYTED|nr:AF17_10 [Mytilus edulis]